MLNVDCTRPPRACKGKLPYAAPPHDLVADPRLSPTDVRVAAALMFWARAKAHCWPSDATIGRRVGRSPGTVQRSLRRLEAAGWIRRERSSANRTGRLVVLAWREGEGARPAPAPATAPPAAPARDEGTVIVKETDGKGGAGTPERSRSERASGWPSTGPRLVPIAPAPAEDPRPGLRTGVERTPEGVAPRPWSISAEQKSAWLGSDDPILRAEALRRSAPRPPEPERPGSTPDLLARIRESPANVVAAAEMLARELNDRKSWAAFHAACRRAWSGEVRPEALVIAHREATGGRARSPGAVFMAVLKREARA